MSLLLLCSYLLLLSVAWVLRSHCTAHVSTPSPLCWCCVPVYSLLVPTGSTMHSYGLAGPPKPARWGMHFSLLLALLA